MFYYKNFLKKISECEARGEIDAKSALALKNSIGQDKLKQVAIIKKIATFLLWTMGMFVFALGATLFAESVWDELSRAERTLVAFLPLALSIIFGAFTIWKNSPHAWKEATGVLNIFGVCCAITLSEHIWQMESSTSGFYVVAIILTLPMGLLLRSGLMAVFNIVMLMMFIDGTRHFEYRTQSVEIFFTTLIPIAGWIALEARSGKLKYFFYPAGLFLLASLQIMLFQLVKHHPCVHYITLASLYWGALLAFSAKNNLFCNILKIITFIAFCIILGNAITFESQFFSTKFETDIDKLTLTQFYGLEIIFAVAWIITLRNSLKEKDVNICFIILSFIAPIFVMGAFTKTLIGVGSLFGFGVAIAIVVIAISKRSLINLNFGLIIIFVASLCLFGARKLPPTTSSLILIGVGIATIALNILVHKAKKNEN